MRGVEQRSSWLHKQQLEPLKPKKHGLLGEIVKLLPASWRLGLAGTTLMGGLQAVRPPAVGAEPLPHQAGIVTTVPSREPGTPTNPAEVTQSLVLEANKFEGALGARLSDAWQDEGSDVWNIAYENAVLQRGKDGKPAFRPVLGELRDMELANLIEQDLGVAVPVLFDGKGSTDPESAFQESARLLGVPQNVVDTANWLRRIAETGPFTSAENAEGSALTFTTNSIAIQNTDKGPQLLPIGKLAVNLGLVPQLAFLKAPDIGSGDAPTVQPPASEVQPPAEILPWLEQIPLSERLVVVNKGKQSGVKLNNHPLTTGLLENVLWIPDRFNPEDGKMPGKFITYESTVQLSRESELSNSPHTTMLWPWDGWASLLPVHDENGNFIEAKRFPKTFKDGALRFGVKDGVRIMEVTLPEPLPGVVPDPLQITVLGIPDYEVLPILRLLLSDANGQPSEALRRYQAAQRSIPPDPEILSHRIEKIVGPDIISPFQIVYNPPLFAQRPSP